MDERDALYAEIDRNYAYVKLFVSEESQKAITALVESTHKVAGKMRDILAASTANPAQRMNDFRGMADAQKIIIELSENALRSVYLSAKEDLRFAFEMPFTGYVIGEGRREPPRRSNQRPED